ncbi:hypothetical protein LINGRAHAP2_LOCUS24795 [Linum grandiflorum]
MNISFCGMKILELKISIQVDICPLLKKKGLKYHSLHLILLSQRRMYKYKGNGRCFKNSTSPPCTGWVEMMAPVFSKAAWRCVWYMIQNDLIHAWGLDTQLGYCAQGDRAKNVGVVDSEYIVHLGLPTLGVFNKTEAQWKSLDKVDKRPEVRMQSLIEMRIFKKRWENAVEQDKCWIDPYQSLVNRTTKL